jgi:hypothetical protein
MATSTLTAIVTTVKLGSLEFEGLMFTDGSYGIAAPQVSVLFQFANEHASRSIKSLLGEGFQFAKAKTSLNPKAVNILQLVEFERLLLELALNGNQQAINITRSLVGLSLTQLYSDAFEQQFDIDDRQLYLKSRLASKVTRRNQTDAIKDYLDRHPEKSDNYKSFIYSMVSDLVNKAVFGVTAKQLRTQRNLPSTQLLRDTHSPEHLTLIERIEDFAMRLIDKQDIEPIEATKEAITFYQS